MHKSKGRARKSLGGLKDGNLEDDQLAQNTKIAEPPPSIANDDSSINNCSLEGKKDEILANNGARTQVRTSAGAEEHESPPLSHEIEAVDDLDISRELWIKAYTGLQNGDGTNDLVNIYEMLQSTFKATTSDWEDIIAHPPFSVNKAYEMLLMRVDDGDKEAVRVVLHLMIAARRPLTLCEMNIALHVRIQPEISDETLELSADGEFKQWLLHTCGFFITIYDDRVSFIHQTAKEFLLRPDLENSRSDGDWYHSITNRNAERMMAESCIAYLSLKQFHRKAFQDRASDIQDAQLEYESNQEAADVRFWCADPWRVDSAYDRVFTDFKFLHYALGFWARHFRSCQYMDEATVVDVGDIFFDKYLKLFATTSPGPPSWLLVALYGDRYLDWHDEGRQQFRYHTIQGYSVAKVAAYYNHFRLFQHAVQQSGLQPTETGREADLSNRETTLLHLAIFKDCSTDFLGLLASHVNVNTRESNSGKTALSMAGSLGDRRAMHVLLDHGADPKIADYYGYSPLSHVARHYLNASPPENGRYLTIMDRLFSHGANADCKLAPEESRERPVVQPGSLLTTAAVSTFGLADMRKKLEALVASRCGDMNPRVSSLARAIMCPDFDLFSEPAFLDAFDQSFIKLLLDCGASVDSENEIGDFTTRTALQSAYCYPGEYSSSPCNDDVFLGIAFLLHVGASPLPLSPDPNPGRLWWARDFDMFKNKPASWMLLMKSLSYDPLSPPQDSTLSYQASGTLLHEAVQWYCSSADWVWLMLERGEDIESRDEEGQTALHVACTQGTPVIVDFLLQQGADVDARNDNGQTPLHVAKNAKVVQSLCAAGADANARDNDKLTPLHRIWHNDCSAAVVTLLEHDAEVSARDGRGRTPLHLACQCPGFDKRYTGQVEVLLQYADIDAKDAEGTSPLHEACGHYSYELVKVLLAHHADIEARDARGRTPIHRICEPSEIDHKMYDPQEARRQTLKFLLTHQANIEALDPQGLTAVHQTMSRGGNHRLLEVLLEHQANIEARDPQGCTPLHVACREGHGTIVDELLDHGANTEARDPQGFTSLHVACREGHHMIVDKLLEHGANAEARDPLGFTPLQLAYREGYGMIDNKLLEDAACNSQNDQVLKDAEISVETYLCEFCSYLFSACDEWIGYQRHHEEHESLLRSLKAGCQLCEKLKEGWDHFAGGWVHDPTCYSLASPGWDEMTLSIRSKTYSESYDVDFKMDLYQPSLPCRVSIKDHSDSVSQWFDACTGSSHSACNEYRKQQGRKLSRPSRLLHFPRANNQTKTVQLIEVQMEKTYRYATLSHRWGKDDAEPPKLSRHGNDHNTLSYNTMIKGITTSILPRIFRQALQIVQSCDLEYLWIDCLCIIQDKDLHGQNQDWEREASKVGDIYAGGLFNIAAISSDDSEGSLVPETKEFSAPVVWHHNRKALVRIIPDSDKEFERQVLSKELLSRGWVFQEVVLAPATLFCTAQQMWWLCHEGRYCQNPLSYSGSYSEISERRSPYSRPPFTEPRDAIAKTDTSSPFFKAWGELLRYYIRTSVTREDDRLVAIAGLAKVYQSLHFRALHSAGYHSGLWSTSIIDQLGWHTTSIDLPKSRYAADHFIPSWSPVSCYDKIEYVYTSHGIGQLPIECNMDTSELDQFGRARTIEEGILHLRGVLIEMTLGPVKFNGQMKDMVWPSTDRRLTFGIDWDNQEEMISATQSLPNNRLRALILSFERPEGLLLRRLQNDDSESPDRWVRCGYVSLSFEEAPWEEVRDGIQLDRYGVYRAFNRDAPRDYDLRPTGKEPDLEDIYLA